MELSFKTFSIQKLGNAPDENEDSFLVPAESMEQLVAFAVSDGATESSFAREWSELLVANYTNKRFSEKALPATIKELSGRLLSLLNTKTLPWYAQQKMTTGAFATFLGVTINRKKKVFDCVAIGDSVLFHIRDKQVLYSFPLTSSDQFGNTPGLLASNSQYQTDFNDSVRYAQGQLKPGDQLILASDALSEWLFRQKETDCSVGGQVKRIAEKNEGEFKDWLNKNRKNGEIKNDDSTLICINFS